MCMPIPSQSPCRSCRAFGRPPGLCPCFSPVHSPSLRSCCQAGKSRVYRVWGGVDKGGPRAQSEGLRPGSGQAPSWGVWGEVRPTRQARRQMDRGMEKLRLPQSPSLSPSPGLPGMWQLCATLPPHCTPRAPGLSNQTPAKASSFHYKVQELSPHHTFAPTPLGGSSLLPAHAEVGTIPEAPLRG